MPATDDLRTRYVPITDVGTQPTNAKAHDIEDLLVAFDEFGFMQSAIHDGRTDRIIAGHGRLEALTLWNERRTDAPKHCRRRKDGVMLMPVSYGWSSIDDVQATRAALALNRHGEGLWHEDVLEQQLREINETSTLDGTGWTTDDLDRLAAELGTSTPPAEPPDTSPALGDVEYRIVIQCTDEAQQRELIERFEAEGLDITALSQ